MVYSFLLDVVFCKYCVLMMFFEGRKNKGVFVNKFFIIFYKFYEKVKDYQGINYYNEFMIVI